MKNLIRIFSTIFLLSNSSALIAGNELTIIDHLDLATREAWEKMHRYKIEARSAKQDFENLAKESALPILKFGIAGGIAGGAVLSLLAAHLYMPALVKEVPALSVLGGATLLGGYAIAKRIEIGGVLGTGRGHRSDLVGIDRVEVEYKSNTIDSNYRALPMNKILRKYQESNIGDVLRKDSVADVAEYLFDRWYNDDQSIRDKGDQIAVQLETHKKWALEHPNLKPEREIAHAAMSLWIATKMFQFYQLKWMELEISRKKLLEKMSGWTPEEIQRANDNCARHFRLIQ